MSRLTCKYDGGNALREMCTFDRESSTEADDWMDCVYYCEKSEQCGGCENCAIQRAVDKLAGYEDLEEKQELKMNSLVPRLKELKKELEDIQYDKSRFNICRMETSYETRMAKITPDILSALQKVIEIYEGTEMGNDRK